MYKRSETGSVRVSLVVPVSVIHEEGCETFADSCDFSNCSFNCLVSLSSDARYWLRYLKRQYNPMAKEQKAIQGLEIIAPRELVASYLITHGKMTIEANEQRNQWRVDDLEPEVATDDVTDSVFDGSWFLDDIFQYTFCQHATHDSQHPQHQQMNVCLPLPRIQSEGLEHSQCCHHKRGANDTCYDRFFPSFIHIDHKGTDFFCHSSQKHAEYPKYLVVRAEECTFALDFEYLIK